MSMTIGQFLNLARSFFCVAGILSLGCGLIFFVNSLVKKTAARIGFL